MPFPVTTEITLRTARGIIDLVLREIGPDQLVAEGEHTLRSGREAEFQFALPGANANLRGQVELERVVKLALGPTRTVLRITEMNKDQQGMLREWLADRSQEHAARQPVKKPPPPSVEQMRGMHSASISSEVLDPDSGVGRQAISEAITADPERKQGRRSTLRRGVQDRRGQTDGAPEAPRKRRRVEVKVAATASPPIVMVRFNDPERYVAYYWKHLHRDALQVRYDASELEVNTQVSVRLVLPGGSTVKCTGHVRAASPQGFALRLDLDATARSTLALSAGPRPRAV